MQARLGGRPDAGPLSCVTAQAGAARHDPAPEDEDSGRSPRLQAALTRQLEQHAADTTLLASQRARFATAAAAQQQQLASTQDGVADVAQEVLDAENFVSTSQANAGYGTAMPSVGRRLLGEL